MRSLNRDILARIMQGSILVQGLNILYTSVILKIPKANLDIYADINGMDIEVDTGNTFTWLHFNEGYLSSFEPDPQLPRSFTQPAPHIAPPYTKDADQRYGHEERPLLFYVLQHFTVIEWGGGG